MTTAQSQAIDKVMDIMREHFEAGVLCVLTEEENEGEGDAMLYHGGRMTCLGLIQSSGDRLLTEKPRGVEEA